MLGHRTSRDDPGLPWILHIGHVWGWALQPSLLGAKPAPQTGALQRFPVLGPHPMGGDDRGQKYYPLDSVRWRICIHSAGFHSSTDKCPVNYGIRTVHISFLFRTGWVLYFQLMSQLEKAACYRFKEIIQFLPAFTLFTFKCILLSSNNFL